MPIPLHFMTSVETPKCETPRRGPSVGNNTKPDKDDLPFEFSSFELNENGQISQEAYSAYWSNSPEYTQALFKYYDTDGIEGLSKTEFEKAQSDLNKAKSTLFTPGWKKAIEYVKSLKGTTGVSYIRIHEIASRINFLNTQVNPDSKSID